MEGRFNGDPYCAPVCPGCGTEWPRDARRGDRPGGDPLRELRRRRDAVHVHQRLHDRVRRAAHGRRDGRPGGGRGVRPRGRALRRAARQLGPEPDPARSRRTTSSALATRLRPFLGQIGTSPSTTIPDSHNAGDFGSFLIGAPHRYALDAQELQRAQDRRPHGHRRGARRRDPRSARSSSPAAASTSATCTRSRATARSPATPATSSGTVTLAGRGGQGPRRSTARSCSRVAEDLPFLARPLIEEERMRALALATPLRRRRARGVAADLGRRHRPGPQLAPPTTASRARPSCSA